MRYDLFEIKTDHLVGCLDQDGQLEWVDPLHRPALMRVIGRELLTRESADPHSEDFGEVIEEGEMCFMDQRSVIRQDKDYLAVLLRQLPILTGYEARPVVS